MEEVDVNKVKAVMKAYWPSIQMFWRWVATLHLTMIVNTALGAWLPFLLRNIAKTMATDPSGVDGLDVVMALIIILQVLSNGSWFGFNWSLAEFEIRAMHDLNERSFAVIQSKSMRFFENEFSGALVNIVTRFRGSFEGIADAYFQNIAPTALLVVTMLVVFSFQAPLMAALFLVWVVFFLTVSVYMAKLRFPLGQADSAASSKVTGVMADSFTKQATVKSFAKERDEQRRFQVVLDDYLVKRRRAWMSGTWAHRIRNIIVSILELGIIWYLIRNWRSGAATVSDFIFFQTYVLVLVRYISDLGNVIHRVFLRVAEAQEMAAIFAERPEVQDAPNARPLIVERGDIDFHSVKFKYVDSGTLERHDIHELSISIPAGQSVGLVGRSGAGKSTFVKLLQRNVEPQFGRICIDGKDIADVTQDSLRQQIALVPQDPEMFHRSIFDNILFARPDASEGEVIEAAKRANAWGFISRKPKGLHSVVGERGVKLSAGERQRIAVARAILANAPILVFDEATSAQDTKTERGIQRAIASLMKGRTTIVIAHRLSTVERVDRILVMEQGEIIEDGTHSELLAKKGMYAELVRPRRRRRR